MNLLSLIQNSLPVIILVIVLMIIGVVLFARLHLVNKGIRELTNLLKHYPSLSKSNLPKSISNHPSLSKLATKAFNTVTEAELELAHTIGLQKIQTIMLDQVTDALIVVDDMLEIRFANQASKTLFKSDADLVGRQLIEVSLDHRFTSAVELALELTEGSIQERVHTTNGSRYFLIESGPVDPAYQLGKGAWLMIRDVTLQEQTERTRKDFVANASHELRTPLSIIKGYLEMLEDDQDHAHAVGIMTKHTDRLTRIVEDMLLISRIESGDGSELQKAAIFDIGDCVDDTVDRLSPMIEEQKAVVKVQLPKSENREFYGDRFYWDQILFNLIENALKQNPRPSLRIKVIVEKEPRKNLFTIKVIDNGIGIPAGDLEEIFKRFYRVDKSHSQKVKGTGLGLSIVRRAVEAHNGTISVTSSPHDKTSFIITVPGPPIATTDSAASV